MTALLRQLTTIAAALSLCLSAYGQQADGKADADFRKAAVFHRNYQFGKAEEHYSKALEQTTDSTARMLIMDRIIQCRNGRSMMQYIIRPEAAATGTFSIEDFTLYLDMPDGSWIPIPNPFVRIPERQRHPYCNSMYFTGDGSRVIFSAPDESGAWSLYVSDRKDSVTWSVPSLLSANILSGRNEIFPILSGDGKTLYFASDGLPGMGGYDLFYSTWDDMAGDWSIPENMGFPYSSTGDDILFFNTADGQYSVTVSNRETPADSVRIYVSGYIPTPVRTPLGQDESPLMIASFASAAPEAEDTSRKDDPSATESGDGEQAGYSQMMHELRHLQNEQKEKLDKIEESRRIYENASDDDRQFLAEIIRDVEQEALAVKKKIDALTARIRKAEIHFLSEGIIPDVYGDGSSPTGADRKDQTGTAREYRFRKHAPGKIPYMTVETPKPEFDYSFKILDRDKGQFAEDNTLPSGIVYQIQFAVLADHAKVRDIRGMSPVFVTRQPSGKYLHTVGLFRTYDEAKSCLGRVRKNGFAEAFIIAFKDGKSIRTNQARELEGKYSPQNGPQKSRTAQSQDLPYRIILKGYGTSLPETLISAINEACGKDISRTGTGDGTVFTVGPFSDKDEAETTARILQGLDFEGISVESIKL